MKIQCSDCSREFELEEAEQVRIVGTDQYEYQCPCGCSEFVIRDDIKADESAAQNYIMRAYIYTELQQLTTSVGPSAQLMEVLDFMHERLKKLAELDQQTFRMDLLNPDGVWLVEHITAAKTLSDDEFETLQGLIKKVQILAEKEKH